MPRTILPTPSHTRRLPPRMVLSALALTSGCAESSEPARPLEYADEAVEAVELIRHIPFSVNDALGIVRVSDLVATTDGYAVADAGGQVLLLDSALELAHRYGREGSGPAELRLPLDLEPLPDGGLAVYDSGNHRIAFIDSAGRPLRTLPPVAAPPSDFAVLSSGSIVVSRFGREHGLVHYTPPGGGPFGRLAPGLGADPGDRESAALRSVDALLVSGSDGTVHQYDSHGQRLYSYAPDGSLVALRRFPDHTLELLEASREAAEKAFGKDRVVGFSSVLGMSGVGPHPLMMAPALPEVPGIGLVLDRTGPTATPVVAGSGVTAADFERITRFVLRGNVLTAATAEALYQYRIRYPSHLAALSDLPARESVADPSPGLP